jgi:hypothetical protein
MTLRGDEADLKVEILHRDHAALRNLETWGSSLLLGAIAVVTKQLAEWDFALEPPHVQLPAWACAVPYALGLFGFVLLRTVNFHLRRTTQRLWGMVGQELKPAHRLGGLLGGLLACAPASLGLVAIIFLVRDDPRRVPWATGAFLALTLVAALAVATIQRRAAGLPRDVRLSSEVPDRGEKP